MAIGQRVNKEFSSKYDPSDGIKTVPVDADYTANGNELLVCDTNGTTLASGVVAYTITLPADPKDGEVVRVMDGFGNAQNRPILVARNGKTINLQADDITLDVNSFDVKFVYVDVDSDWKIGGK